MTEKLWESLSSAQRFDYHIRRWLRSKKANVVRRSDAIEDLKDIEDPKDVIEDPKDVIEDPKDIIEDPKDIIEGTKDIEDLGAFKLRDPASGNLLDVEVVDTSLYFDFV